MTATTTPSQRDPAFRHEALLYAGDDEFVEPTQRFIGDGLDAGEPTLVVVDADKIEGLRTALAADADRVHFADMAVVGHNPALIIPAWRAFVDEHRGTGRRLRGIGEPISPARGPAELMECQRHESLLNVAFDGAPDWWLLCPYDTDALDADVIDEAERSHPFVRRGDDAWSSAVYRDLATMAAPLDTPLPEPAAPVCTYDFDGFISLALVRRFVADVAGAAGLDTVRTVELVGAVQELAANSVRHGGGRGVLRTWQEPGVLICEVCDRGYLDKPLADRESPALDSDGGRGLWLANQFCDLVQIRSSDAGTVIRLHKCTGSSPGPSTL